MGEQINIENYEAFWLDYIEGTLSEKDKKSLFLWLNDHPELKSELEEDLPYIEEEVVLFHGKNELKKTIPSTSILAGQDIDTVLIASIERKLELNEEEELARLIKKEKWLEKEVAYYQKTILPIPTIPFENKEDLKKRGILIPLYTRVIVGVGTAAAVLLFAWNFIQFDTNPSNPVAANENLPGQTEQSQEAISNPIAEVTVKKEIETEELIQQVTIAGEQTTKKTENDIPQKTGVKQVKLNPPIKRVAEKSFSLAHIGVSSIVTEEPNPTYFLVSRNNTIEVPSIENDLLVESENKGVIKKLKALFLKEGKLQDGLTNLLAFGKQKVTKQIDAVTNKETIGNNESEATSWALAIGPLRIKHSRFK